MGDRASPVFAGRTDELGTLEQALDRARAGSSATVLVGGEAGVGKSRLITELARCAGDARVLVGGCLELGTDGLPYAPFSAVLRHLVRELGADEVAALTPGGQRDLGRLLPEFGEPAADDDSAAARARLFERMLVLLERLAEERPVVLVVEDAHWADRSTRDLIVFLVRSLRHSPVLLVVTYRTDDLHRTHPLRPLLAELGRIDAVTRLELTRLDRRDIARPIATIGTPPACFANSASTASARRWESVRLPAGVPMLSVKPATRIGAPTFRAASGYLTDLAPGKVGESRCAEVEQHIRGDPYGDAAAGR